MDAALEKDIQTLSSRPKRSVVERFAFAMVAPRAFSLVISTGARPYCRPDRSAAQWRIPHGIFAGLLKE